MEQYFAKTFQDVTYEKSLKLLLSLTDPDILKQNKFTDDEHNPIKKSSSRIFTKTKIFKETLCLTIIRMVFSVA